MSSVSISEKVMAAPVLAPMSVALRNLLLTFSITGALLALAGRAWGATGYEILIVSMGWPHIILGFLFYFGKVLRGEGTARRTFLLSSLATLGIWAAHYTYTITGLISIYFVYHVLRDEVFVYFRTRARHSSSARKAYVAGFIPFILLMFLVNDPRPQHYRQDLRKVEIASTQLSHDGWSLIRFKSIPDSSGRDYYFFLQAPHTEGIPGYTALATQPGSGGEGQIRISDRPWTEASNLVFKPYYQGDEEAVSGGGPVPDSVVPVLLTGGHRVGQVFKASQDSLAGFWVFTRHSEDSVPVSFVFHLTTDTSVSMEFLSPGLQFLRYALIAILLAALLWKALPQVKQNRAFWAYFVLLLLIFGILNRIIRTADGSGYEVPIMFQLVVIFHYVSWYVFSFDKLRSLPSFSSTLAGARGLYDRLLGTLRRTSSFAFLVVTLNILFTGLCLWFYKWDGPPLLRYAFGYNYFLYMLVFHVTFSFGPKDSNRSQTAVAKPIPG